MKNPPYVYVLLHVCVSTSEVSVEIAIIQLAVKIDLSLLLSPLRVNLYMFSEATFFFW